MSKASNLIELEKLGLPVPEFTLLSQQNVSQAGRKTIQDLQNFFSAKDIDLISVRSSPEKSLPGILKTKLNVDTRRLDSFWEATTEVFDSYNTSIAKLAYRKYKISQPKVPEIIFQRMVDGSGGFSGSGIWYHRDPKGSDYPTYAFKFNATGGVVDGEKANDELFVGWRDTLEKFGEMASEHFGYPQELEFTIEEGKVWILQSRDIVFEKGQHYPEVPNKLLAIGTGIAHGIGTGRVSRRPKEDDFILVTDQLQVDESLLNDRCKGIIVKEGNPLCHAAIIARKEGIPCVIYENVDELLEVKVLLYGNGKIYHG